MTSVESKTLPAVKVRRSTVRNRGVDLAVFEQGDPSGQTVVFVHGWPDTHTLWDQTIALMPKNLHIVCYDTAGNGDSSEPVETARFALAELASDFFAVADAVSPDKPVHIVAHDWGSSQMWEAVTQRGAEERVASYTSISGPQVDQTMLWMRKNFDRPSLRGVWNAISQGASSAYMLFFISPLSGPVFDTVATPKNWERFVRFVDRVTTAKYTFSDTLQHDMRQGVRIYRANLWQKALRPEPGRVAKIPIQLLVNRRDPALRPAIYDEVDTWTTNSVVREDRKTGHWVPYSHPEWIASSATAFIERVVKGQKR